MGAPDRMGHVLRRVRSDGVGAAARHSLDLARAHLYLVEEHVWYQLDVAGERPRRELPEDVRLVRAGDDQLAGAVEMGQRLEEVRARRAAGNDLWLAEDAGGPLFRCWIYRAGRPCWPPPAAGSRSRRHRRARGLRHHPAGPRPRHCPGSLDGDRRLAPRRGPRPHDHQGRRGERGLAQGRGQGGLPRDRGHADGQGRAAQADHGRPAGAGARRGAGQRGWPG